ncbi:MAG: acyl-CoA reductase [Flavobacteriales bacterium]|jgi:hypothetical protein|nr:acyl-CoA reductase [Flavobacteriales bacterium]|tara:strand:+ start:3146 stop:4180 length:1035 start_codon:yes stop_codon:yes gene_type:complete
MFFTDHRIEAVSQLGLFIREFVSGKTISNGHEDLSLELKSAINQAFRHNGWFIEQHVTQALKAWGSELTLENLQNWRAQEGGVSSINRNRVGIVMAGNIPLVGLHDFLSVFLSGHFAIVKMSSDDQYILPVLVKVLLRYDELFEGDWIFVDQLSDIGAVIATGSDNTSRYFEYYFGKYPNIIRKNRTSVAVLTGQESKEELQGLGSDIFSYFGMGCRSVSHLLVPVNYDIQQVFAHIVEYNDVINNNKYGNNYDYYRALFLLNQDDFLENGFLIVRENEVLHTPVSILHFSTYGKEGPADQLTTWGSNIQCVVGQAYLPLGTAQKPRLWDYADGANTMEFLKNL